MGDGADKVGGHQARDNSPLASASKWPAFLLETQISSRLAGHRHAQIPRGYICPRLLLAPAPWLQSCHHPQIADFLLGCEIRKKYRPGQEEFLRTSQARVEGFCCMGVRGDEEPGKGRRQDRQGNCENRKVQEKTIFQLLMLAGQKRDTEGRGEKTRIQTNPKIVIFPYPISLYVHGEFLNIVLFIRLPTNAVIRLIIFLILYT